MTEQTDNRRALIVVLQTIHQFSQSVFIITVKAPTRRDLLRDCENRFIVSTSSNDKYEYLTVLGPSRHPWLWPASVYCLDFIYRMISR